MSGILPDPIPEASAATIAVGKALIDHFVQSLPVAVSGILGAADGTSVTITITVHKPGGPA